MVGGGSGGRGHLTDARAELLMSLEETAERPRVLILGGGFGGLELTTRLSEEFGEEIEVVLIDQNDSFVFGFSKLDVMFGRAARRRGPTPLREHRQAGCAVRADGGPRDRPCVAHRGDRCGHVHGRRDRRGAGSRPRPRSNARSRGGRARVLHRGGRIRGARGARSVRGRPGHHRRARRRRTSVRRRRARRRCCCTST